MSRAAEAPGFLFVFDRAIIAESEGFRRPAHLELFQGSSFTTLCRMQIRKLGGSRALGVGKVDIAVRPNSFELCCVFRYPSNAVKNSVLPVFGTKFENKVRATEFRRAPIPKLLSQSQLFRPLAAPSRRAQTPLNVTADSAMTCDARIIDSNPFVLKTVLFEIFHCKSTASLQSPMNEYQTNDSDALWRFGWQRVCSHE